MKKLQILIIAILISLTICTLMSMQAKAATATISLNPVSGHVGDTITVSGGPFAQGSTISATYNGSPLPLSGSTTITASLAISSNVTFTVPPSVSGIQTVAVTDTSSNSGSTTFTVISSISLNPTSGFVGSSVTVTGTGLLGTHSVTATFGSTPVTLSTSTTTSTGGLSATFTVPASNAGTQTVTLTDGTNSPTATYTVNKDTPTVPAPTLSPSGTTDTGTPLSLSITISGGGATPTGTATFQVKIGSGSYSNIGSAVTLSSGSASTSYTPLTAGSYQFQVIYSGDNVYIGATGSAASLTVNAAPTVSVSPSSWTMDVGQSKTFSATPSGGSGSYPSTGYQWYVGGSAQPGQTGSTFSYSPGSSGSYSITVTVTDSLGSTSAQSPAATVNVAASPTVSITPTGPITMDVGQVQAFTAAASGGSGALSYQWYLDGSAVGSNSASYSYTAAGSSHSVTCRVTDSASAPVTSPASNSVSITVNSALVAPNVTPTPSTINQGQTSSLTSTAVTTGTSPYSYQWLEKAPGSSYVDVGTSSASFSFVTSGSTTTGAWSFELQVTDSATTPIMVTSTAVSVTVNAAPTVSVSPSSWTMDVGQSKTFSATPSGGSGSYPSTGYQWYVGGSAQPGQTGSTFSYSPGSAGSYSITVTVTDSLGSTSAQSPAATVNVAASPTVSITPTGPITMDVGQVQAFAAAASGGSGALSYQWYLDGSAVGSNSASYSYTAAGSSHSVTCRVTDSASAPVTSASNAVSVTVNASPTVSITPVGPITMDAGLVQPFSATASGGSGALSYQWYLDGSAVSGGTSASYSYTAAGSSHSVTCRVTDSASTIVTSPASNAVSVTVNAALVAPAVSVSGGTINQGDTSSLTSATVTTGTSPYQYQWFEKAPAGSYSAQGSNSTSFNFVTSGSTATGTWSFYLRVTDKLGAAVNSATVSVIVDSPSTSHFIFTSIGTQTAGTSFSITITAKGASNNTLTNYVGTNTLTVSSGTINPATTTAFVAGVWKGTVTVTGAGSSIQISTTGSGMSGTSGTFTVNPGVLDHFSYSSISAQTAGSAFSVAVTAQDAYNNTVTSYTGTPSLTYSAGSISPTTMTAFVSGVGSTSVTVTAAGSGVTITATDGNHTGTSNPFTVTLTPTPTPTSSSSPTTTPTPTPTLKPGTTPTPKPSPTPTPSATTITATTETGSTVNIPISGNITKSQISNAAITSDKSAKTITLSFTITGTTGTKGFCNMTIPKNAVSHGTNPVVYVDILQAPNQGYTQDANNFYVWFTTSFSTHQAKIQFTLSSTSSALSLGPVLIVGITVVEIVLVFTVIAVRRLRRKPDSA